MRQLQRAIIAMLAIALVGLVPSTGASAKVAGDAGSAEQVGSAPSAVDETRAEARRETRSVSFKFVSKRGKLFTFKGNVEGKKSWINLQRAGSKNGKYRKFRGMRTNHKGWYIFKNPYVTHKCNSTKWYRLHVPGNKRFKPKYSRKLGVRVRCF